MLPPARVALRTGTIERPKNRSIKRRPARQLPTVPSLRMPGRPCTAMIIAFKFEYGSKRSYLINTGRFRLRWREVAVRDDGRL